MARLFAVSAIAECKPLGCREPSRSWLPPRGAVHSAPATTRPGEGALTRISDQRETQLATPITSRCGKPSHLNRGSAHIEPVYQAAPLAPPGRTNRRNRGACRSGPPKLPPQLMHSRPQSIGDLSPMPGGAPCANRHRRRSHPRVWLGSSHHESV